MRKILDLSKKIFFKVAQKIKINKLFFHLSRNDYLPADPNNVRYSRSFLESLSPNPGTSCITNNIIDEKVDLHIIVPAYNVEKYIRQCLNSVLNHSSKKYTYLVTLVNDGSTDNTQKIISEYEDNPHLELINQENKGFSGARNAALRKIKGKYVAFLDSDDCFDWTGVEKLLDIAFEKNLDIAVGSYTTVDTHGNRRAHYKRPDGNVTSKQLGGQPWAKIFKSYIFSNLCFPEKYWYEDSIFSQIVYPKVLLKQGISENTYFYRTHPASISATNHTKMKSIDSFWITEQLFYERKKLDIQITQDYYDYILHMVYLTFVRIRLQSYEVKKSVFILFVDFINRNFIDFSTNDANLKLIENCIKTNNLGKCIAFAKWM